ncbi:MBL fold metallo-hydrolase [Paenibacillus sp. IB182496]|uniref:MBL fold metallo-hydrolase n=2 Tax=Paenibacillus sabuli TaxID=2772509 RepID=A0A927GS15_9BACL|nr:MBL fold metallo-hydrolase [Paenibacillus sabuli]
MLGTGSAFAKTYNNNNALLFGSEAAPPLLIDCGVTAMSALHSLEFGIDRLHGVLITHIHADHVGGLEELAFRMRFQHQRRPLLYIAAELADPLWNHTLRGGLVQGELQTLEDFFEVRLLHEHRGCELAPGLTIEIIKTPHIPGKPSFSLYVNDRFFYSADMQFQPQLLRDLVEERGCETIFHDCQLFQPGPVHATLEELLTLPTDLQQKIGLMHYGDNRADFEGRTGAMRFVEQQRVYRL